MKLANVNGMTANIDGVYMLLNEDNEVVYVGESKNVLYRIGQHVRNGKIKFNRFVCCRTESREKVETFLIHIFNPQENVAKNAPNHDPVDEELSKFTDDWVGLMYITREYLNSELKREQRYSEQLEKTNQKLKKIIEELKKEMESND